MKVSDGRGANKKIDAKRNKNAVRDWFKQNPDSTITECCKGLGLTYTPVRKHLNALIEEGSHNEPMARIRKTKA